MQVFAHEMWRSSFRCRIIRVSQSRYRLRHYPETSGNSSKMDDNEEIEVVLEDKHVITNINFKVTTCTTLAIVGRRVVLEPTLKLRYRLYDVNGGRILIYVQDISQAKTSSLRDSVSIVPQYTELPNNLVRYSTANGQSHASGLEMLAAGAHPFGVNVVGSDACSTSTLWLRPGIVSVATDSCAIVKNDARLSASVVADMTTSLK